MEDSIKFRCDKMTVTAGETGEWLYEFRFTTFTTESKIVDFYITTTKQIYKIDREYELIEVINV